MNRNDDRLRDVELELDQAQMAYLRTNGWRHTSSTPDCTWLWEKDWNGKKIMVPLNHAIAMQRAWLDRPVRTESMVGVELPYALTLLRSLIATMEQHAPMSIEMQQSNHVREVPHPTRMHREPAGLDTFSMIVRFAPGTAEWVRAEPAPTLAADQQPE